MLKPKYLDQIPDNMIELYSQAEMDILADMARRISTYDYFIPAAQHQFVKLQEMGLLHDEIVKKLSAMTGKTQREIKRLMQEAGATALKADDSIYRKAGLNPTPLDADPALQSVLQSGFDKTSGLFTNLTQTTAGAAQKQFERALDQAYMQVTSGAFDYNSAIRNSIKSLAERGLASIEYPGGKMDNIEVAVRRAVVTGVNSTAGKLSEARAEEMGCDLVETSAHAGARPEHAVWQGKIFSRSGTHPKYPDFVKETGYGTGAGLCGWNCHHSFQSYIEGVSDPAYTQAELDDMNAEKYEYNGKKMTEYEATQQQRHIERTIRKWRREYVAMDAASQPTEEAAAKIAHWQRVQRDFIKQTGLKRQGDREQIPGFGRSEAARAGSINREIASYQELSGIKASNGVTVKEVSQHFGIRAVQRNVTAPAAQDALLNPLKIGKIRADGTQQFIGEYATIAVNTETGKIVTAWRTSTDKSQTLKRRLGKDESQI
ncbi:MAG TPA: phage minor capsid protein [Syntrophomonas sp.]|nr:phage minor capsid protein [Syntrophomonas sp.]